jgi:hypothetical protein
MNNWTNQIPGQFYKYGDAGLPQTFYIHPLGNDSPNTSGNINDPFQTLLYAATRITNPGDTIHFLYDNGGVPTVYLINDICEIAPGVNIEGEGANTILQTTSVAANFRILSFVSAAENTPGNQEIRNLTFDGTLTGYQAIYIYLRNNIKIHHCNIYNFAIRGIAIDGSIGAGEAIIYSVNNEIHDCQITNCGDYAGHGACINIGSQQDMLIYNNTLSNPDRGAGTTGFCITWISNGYWRGVKIFNNYVYREYNANPFNIGMECWYCQGVEIYNNEVVDCDIDLSWSLDRGNYPYTYYCHNNYIHKLIINPVEYPTWGITVEGETRDVIVCNNLIENHLTGISVIAYLAGNITQRIYVFNNIIHNWGNGANDHGRAISLGGANVGSFLRDIFIFNNTCFDDISRAWYCIEIAPVNAALENIHICNNILTSGSARCLITSTTGAATIDKLVFIFNLLFNNGNANVPSFTLVPANYFNDDNVIGDPLFINDVGGDFHLDVGSPAIAAGINYNFQSAYKDYDGVNRPDQPAMGVFEP